MVPAWAGLLIVCARAARGATTRLPTPAANTLSAPRREVLAVIRLARSSSQWAMASLLVCSGLLRLPPLRRLRARTCRGAPLLAFRIAGLPPIQGLAEQERLRGAAVLAGRSELPT